MEKGCVVEVGVEGDMDGERSGEVGKMESLEGGSRHQYD